jgi:aminoglycoside/choline kinase family phosphotransferase
MTIRDKAIEEFLADSGLSEFRRIAIPGDASFRRYERIITPDAEYILMDAPPEKEDVRPFIKIDEILLKLGLSAPKVIAKNIEKGFLLLEDLGNKKFNHLFRDFPDMEVALYKSAVDVLAHIYDNRQRFDIAEYDKEKLMQEASLFTEWYLPLFNVVEKDKLTNIREEFQDIMSRTLDRLKLPNDVIVLRDYHADNLMLLEDRAQAKRVGLLDFQDALHGNVAYDLVSLLEDARRDVPKNIQQGMLGYFLEKTKLENRGDDFLNDYHILGAQRNLKIIGIFSRLKVRDGKEVYLPLIPRVKEYLKQDLKHKSLKELREFLEKKMQPLNITKAFIFAAGLGTRMKPLTDKTPKPLIKVAGKTLLDYSIDMVLDAGIKQIAINTFYLPEQVEGHVQKYLGTWS